MIDKSNYRNIEIPAELDDIVSDAITEGKKLRRKNKVINKRL